MSTIQAQSPLSREASPLAHPGTLGRRIVDTFVSPGALFSRLGPTPPWMDVLVISAVVGALAMALIPADVWTEVARTARAGIADPRAREAMSVEAMAKFSRFSTPITFFIATFLSAFLLAGFLKLVFGVVMKGEATFAQYRGVAAHAALIGALGVVVTLPVWIATRDIETQLSAALLVPDLPRGVLRSVLNAASVFNLWWLAVVAVGVSALNRRVSLGAAAGILFGIFFALAALGGVIAGRAAG